MTNSNDNQLLPKIRSLGEQIDGEVHVDLVTRKIYSTDASVYEEIPSAVAIPKSNDDIQKIIQFANANRIGLIPRTAGTSLAGQVVGTGIIVDVSRHLNQILEINPDENWVRVQPGVIRNELNQKLLPHEMMFGPETATANRAMIGGMLGNNSCGSNSIVYGSVRDRTIEVSGFLSDGTRASFGPRTTSQIYDMVSGPDSLEKTIYKQMIKILGADDNRAEIRRRFPKPIIQRRNTGYALDQMMNCHFFGESDEPFNLCKLLAGSEGTLFFTTEIKLQCDSLPPPESGIQCAHFETLDQALRATQIAVTRSPYACELIDRNIIEGARRNPEQAENLGFVQGTPGAILVTQFRGDSHEDVARQARVLESKLRKQDLGFSFPVLHGVDSQKVWSVRKSGLGVLANLPGDAKPVTVIEDTAVDVGDLPKYIREFNRLLSEKYDIDCVHYAHVGTGEIHLRPMLNLRKKSDVKRFREIAEDVAQLVKWYRGSLSGEHGDGRLRSEFIPTMVGSKNYELMRQVKQTWDPNNVFNPNKIIDPVAMDKNFRIRAGQPDREIETVLDFGTENGIQRAAEACNGSGDCRTVELKGGVMCPSYQATRNERDSTRARANLLRHILTTDANPNALAEPEIHEIMDLCLSCKGCKRECPSNVDVAKLKSEALQSFHDRNGIPFRTRLISEFERIMAVASLAPWAYNFFVSNRLTGRFAKWLAGIHAERTIPKLSSTTLRSWAAKHEPHPNAGSTGRVHLFCDEFTNFVDVPIGIAAIELLEILGYDVVIPKHVGSGRAMISKGMLKRARTLAERNVKQLSTIVSSDEPLVGIEPSAILSFRDEYPDLVNPSMRDTAKQLGDATMTIEEFICSQFDQGKIKRSQFTDDRATIQLHGHCHQKSLGVFPAAIRMLQTPQNYSVRVIPSGCCGMAGSFGLEKEHFELSMRIGELSLFPSISSDSGQEILATSGTSCRHQISDGTGFMAQHPVEILRAAVSPPVNRSN